MWTVSLNQEIRSISALGRDQILSTRENVNIGIRIIGISWQSFRRLASNRRHRKVPAQPKRGHCPRRSHTTTKASVKIRAGRRGCNRNAEGRGSRGGIDRKLLADVADRSAAFGE